MKASLLVLYLVALAVVVVAAVQPLAKDPDWEAFVAKYNKRYSDDVEAVERQRIFLRNKEFVMMHENQGSHSFSVSLNEYADRTVQEMQQLGRLSVPKVAPPAAKIGKFNWLCTAGKHIPASFDWRSVFPPTNQGQMGSSSVIVVTESISDGVIIKSGPTIKLSQQQLLDCVGGESLPSKYYQWIISNKGIASAANYPSNGQSGTCRQGIPPAVTISAYTDVAPGNETELACAVAFNLPVSVCVDSSHTSFQLYSGGVYYEPACSSSKVDHCMLITGFGVTSSGKEYWIVENSWGEDWGINGYIWMARNRNNNCGIATFASMPTVGSFDAIAQEGGERE